MSSLSSRDMLKGPFVSSPGRKGGNPTMAAKKKAAKKKATKKKK
jgi:hypothetical protein